MRKIILPKTDEDLLQLCKVETFKSSGKGGQAINKTDSAVRITFIPNKIVVTCKEERSQYLNKMRCLEKLREKVEKLNYRAPKRIPTKMSRSKKEENLNKKAKASAQKKLRRKIILD